MLYSSGKQNAAFSYIILHLTVTYIRDLILIGPEDADGMANSVDPDQTAPLGLHCLPRPVCPKT